MDPRTANQIGLSVAVVIVWFVFELVIRRGRMKRAMVFDGLIVAIFLVGATLFADDVSLRVMAVIAGILLMVLLLFAAIFLIRSMGWLFGFRRKWLARMGKPRIEAPDALLPDPVRRAVERFEAIGFQRVTTTIDEGGSVVAHLLRADGVVAEAIVDPMGSGAVFDYTSILDGGRGTLVTSNTGLGCSFGTADSCRPSRARPRSTYWRAMRTGWPSFTSAGSIRIPSHATDCSPFARI